MQAKGFKHQLEQENYLKGDLEEIQDQTLTWTIAITYDTSPLPLLKITFQI